jgi:hypothetical protein
MNGTAAVVSLMWLEKEYGLANMMGDGEDVVHGQRCKAIKRVKVITTLRNLVEQVKKGRMLMCGWYDIMRGTGVVGEDNFFLL